MMSEGRPHRLETTTVDLRSSIHFAHLDGVDRFPQLTPLRGACKGRQPNDNATTCGSRNPNFDVPWHGDLGSRGGHTFTGEPLHRAEVKVRPTVQTPIGPDFAPGG